MNLQEFAVFMQGKGYSQQSKIAFVGFESGYPVSAIRLSSSLIALNFTLRVDAPRKEMLKDKTFKEELKANNLSALANANTTNVLQINVNVKKTSAEEAYAAALQVALNLFARFGIAPENHACPVCGVRGCGVAVMQRGACVPYHKSCLEQQRDAQAQKVGNAVEDGSYFTGILGGIAGAVVGILPSLLVIVLSNTIYGMLFALIPMAIAKGYRMAKGKPDKVSIVITVVLSILSVYLLQSAVMVQYLMSKYGFYFGEAISEIFYWITNTSFLLEITTSSSTEFVFMVLGLWISWSYISNTGESGVGNLSAMIDGAYAIPENTFTYYSAPVAKQEFYEDDDEGEDETEEGFFEEPAQLEGEGEPAYEDGPAGENSVIDDEETAEHPEI